jgi:hypothetical protein
MISTEVLDPGVRAQAGGDQRAAGDAEPRRVHGGGANQPPGQQAGGEAVTAAGGVHHVQDVRAEHGHRSQRPG